MIPSMSHTQSVGETDRNYSMEIAVPDACLKRVTACGRETDSLLKYASGKMNPDETLWGQKLDASPLFS